ncbi:Rv1733c family protein [Amycolatopsis taiwanensis]|uniref:Membrane protein n=1 Tax=Amycolatopsis taiwanensis TaxID=342230 RepID=A0A9W6R3D3_9PSEU|nr:hypothetical protein [Amycolatopsis taiwanensis]GLY67783.1 membrane protein [Amycolatopsis taiwanensis]
MVAASTNWLMRQYRWLLPRRGSLARRCDRIEAAVALAVLVLALVAVPVGMLAGSVVHHREATIAAAQQAERHPATAVLLTPTDPDTAGYTGVAVPTEKIPARWQAGGTDRTGLVEAGPGLSAGDHVGIWLDQAGNPVSAPMSGLNVLGLSIGFGALVWAGGTVAGLFVYWIVRAVLDRARLAAWAREWEAVRWRPRSKGDSK